MSCCGEPDKKANNAHATSALQTQPNAQQPPISQQPAPKPSLQWPSPGVNGEKPFHPPPGPTPPPPAHPSAYGTWESQPSPPTQVPSRAYASQGSSPPVTHPNGIRPLPSIPGSPSPEAVSSTYAGSTHMQIPPLARTHPDRTLAMSVSSRGSIPPIIPQQPSFAEQGKLSISIDFGTTFSSVAYGSSHIAAGKVQSLESLRKIPTCLVYDQRGQVIAWGAEAKNASPVPGTVKCEWFKLHLEPHALRDETDIDSRTFALPPGRRAIDLITDFLTCLWTHAKQQIAREIGAVADLDSADVWLTVPATWDAAGSPGQVMRDAAIAAGLVRSARVGDDQWRDRLHIISEPEAAVVHCADLTDVHKLSPNQNFMICDAGGGTVKLSVYRVIGMLSSLEIGELCAHSAAKCGSLFLDLRFRELMKALLVDHPVHLDRASLAHFMENFSGTEKLRYMGEEDDDQMFHFSCLNVEDPDDPAVGLANGKVTIPGNMLRREVFDPIVDEVLQLIEAQAQKVNERLDALLLVGGFSANHYLFRKVQERFKSRIRVIARSADCDTATVRGAAQCGLARRPLVSSVIAPQSYMLKVKLPAENEDWLKRPAYIRENDTGAAICENRLQYLVAKGAILRKGQRLKTTFCKFSQTPNDRMFVATVYTSDSDKIMRYTDEGEINELCKWTIDLGALPSFQQNANAPNPNGFYTEFEIGLEVDSAEVRGVLVYQGNDWGKVVFDYRS